jgi:hypothetical protein
MTRADREALQLAIDQTLAEDDLGRVEQVRWKLSTDGWRETAEFCSYHRQMEALRLKPWQSPPSQVSLRSASQYDTEARALLDRMLKGGISRYHPDPLAALAEAERAAER